jgi:hypothetical protein
LYPGMGLLMAWKPIMPTQLASIVDAVRTRVLDLALHLETILPDAGRAGVELVDSVQLTQMVTNVYGGNVARGNTGVTQQSLVVPSMGDLAALRSALLAAGISQDDIVVLERAIEEDRKAGEGEPGKAMGSRVQGVAGEGRHARRIGGGQGRSWRCWRPRAKGARRVLRPVVRAVTDMSGGDRLARGVNALNWAKRWMRTRPNAQVLDLTGGIGVDAALECVGTGLAAAMGFAIAGPGSTVGVVGVPHGVEVPFDDLFFRKVSACGAGPRPFGATPPSFSTTCSRAASTRDESSTSRPTSRGNRRRLLGPCTNGELSSPSCAWDRSEELVTERLERRGARSHRQHPGVGVEQAPTPMAAPGST